MNEQPLSKMQQELMEALEFLEGFVKQTLATQQNDYKAVGMNEIYKDCRAKVSDLQQTLGEMKNQLDSKKENQTAVEAA